MGCYAALGKDKIIPFAATWMGLEMVTLSEGGQTRKDKYAILFICGV